MSLRDLDLSENPITKIENYRDQIWNILPNLKCLDKIPVIQKDQPRSQSPFGLKRKQIEDVIGKFLVNTVAPNSKEISFDVFRSEMGSPIVNAVKEEKKQGIDFRSLINQSRSESKGNDRDNKSVNMSIATSKVPMVSLEDNKKNDESGLFTFISDKGIDNMKVESVYALKEIVNIQESYIKK